MLKVNIIEVKDCMEGLGGLPDGCVQCCVTSPPYWSLRDYGRPGQYGLEPTPEAYVERMVAVFEEVRRVLKEDGTLWLNLGDAYWGSGKAGNNKEYKKRHKEFGCLSPRNEAVGIPTGGRHPVFKNKDLLGLPWLVAMALRKKGWFLRQDIIWHKRNSMPESITDRCTKAHEYIFLLTKSSRYYFDYKAIQAPAKIIAADDRSGKLHRKGYPTKMINGIRGKAGPYPMANRRSVWSISNRGFREKHFATFPLELPLLCIKAGSRPKDIVLDPFMGAGTTALAAGLLDRYHLGFELNPQYAAMAEKRLRNKFGLFYREQYI